MTNWQLFISAGLPSLLVLVSIWRSDKRMDTMDERFDRTDTRFDRTDARIESLRTELDNRIESFRSELEKKIESVRAELVGRIDRISDDQKQFYMILGEHKGKIETLEKH